MRRWFSRVPAPAAQAVVFFNDNNNRWSSAVMALEKADDFTFCRIEGPKPNLPRPGSYRGKDFKLHTDYRAAVTLGPDLTNC